MSDKSFSTHSLIKSIEFSVGGIVIEKKKQCKVCRKWFNITRQTPEPSQCQWCRCHPGHLPEYNKKK